VPPGGPACRPSRSSSRPDTGDVQSLEQALVENLHREDLNALEEAAAYQQLIDEFGLTHEQVAKRMGKGRATVTNTLRLLQLPAGAQRALADAPSRPATPGRCSGPRSGLQDKLVEQITSEGLTVRAVEEIVRGGLLSETRRCRWRSPGGNGRFTRYDHW
jgi:ParB family chromosome partitioning protein